MYHLGYTHTTLPLEAGANPLAVQERLGHSHLAITWKYAHHTDARNTAAKLDHRTKAHPALVRCLLLQYWHQATSADLYDPHWWGDRPDRGNFAVMTYHQFGHALRQESTFLIGIDLIICDEIHNLVKVAGIEASTNEQEDLLNTPDEQVCCKQALESLGRLSSLDMGGPMIVMLTATPNAITRKFGAMGVPYACLDYYSSFTDVLCDINGKALIYVPTIDLMKEYAELAKSFASKVVCLWSLRSDKEMDTQQLTVREALLQHERIPDGVDVLLMAHASEHGKQQDLTRSTISRVSGLTSHMFKIARELKLVDDTPFKLTLLRNNGRRSSHHKALPDAEVARIKREIPLLEDDRQRLYMGLLVYTGMRREEVLGLGWENIHLAEGYGEVHRVVTYPDNTRTVVKDEPKTVTSERTFIIPAPLKRLLLPFERESGYVIHGDTPGCPASYSTAQRTYRAAFKKLGILGKFNNHDW